MGGRLSSGGHAMESLCVVGVGPWWFWSEQAVGGRGAMFSGFCINYLPVQQVQIAVPVLDGETPIGSLVVGLSVTKMKN